MGRPRRDTPMPVKHWSFAGLMLTYWCNAACASCYLRCGPDRSGQEEMTAEAALGFWRSLAAASPHGCRIHLSGGEPFGDWPRLIEICRHAAAEGLGPLEKVETNCFWATDETLVRDRLAALDAAALGRLVISADPYHQQFVPIERCRLAARLAEEMLGRQRVLVRWRDWLADGFDTADLGEPERADLFRRYACGGRDRLGGRAAEQIAPMLPSSPFASFADSSCRESLLRSRHVHVDPAGRIMPGTCAGIVLATLGQASASDAWQALAADHADRPVVGTLAARGPVGLAEQAARAGFVPAPAYAGKCHLCWDVRRWLASAGLNGRELGPAWMYDGKVR
jgi:hypothetical protein